MNSQQTEGELVCSGKVSSSCSTGGTRRVALVTNLVIVTMNKGIFKLQLYHDLYNV